MTRHDHILCLLCDLLLEVSLSSLYRNSTTKSRVCPWPSHAIAVGQVGIPVSPMLHNVVVSFGSSVQCTCDPLVGSISHPSASL
jgi:hypothetical protein